MTIAEEAARYLAAVDEFRALGCDPFAKEAVPHCETCGKETHYPVRHCVVCLCRTYAERSEQMILKTNIGYVGDLRSALDKATRRNILDDVVATYQTPVRVYDRDNGTEYRIVEASIEDDIFCLDIVPTSTITNAEDER